MKETTSGTIEINQLSLVDQGPTVGEGVGEISGEALDGSVLGSRVISSIGTLDPNQISPFTTQSTLGPKRSRGLWERSIPRTDPDTLT